MTRSPLTKALLAALPLPSIEVEAPVPEWIHLLPIGMIGTSDARGPYLVTDLQSVIAASMAEAAELVVDESHATDLAAPRGERAPAMGWITAMEARADGIWGRVAWTSAGRALVSDRAYRWISPVITHDAAKRVRAILRASLVNRPNLRGLTALNQETDMSFRDQLAEALGLNSDATEEDILVRVRQTTALQSQLPAIGVALGVEGAAPTANALAAAAAAARTAADLVPALQAEIAALKATDSRRAAEAWIEGEIASGRAIPADAREGLIALHAEDPEHAGRIAALYPSLAPTRTAAPPPAATATYTALNAEQARAATLLGIPAEQYLATLKSEKETA